MICSMLAETSLNHVAYSSDFKQISRRFVLVYKFILYNYIVKILVDTKNLRYCE